MTTTLICLGGALLLTAAIIGLLTWLAKKHQGHHDRASRIIRDEHDGRDE